MASLPGYDAWLTREPLDEDHDPTPDDRDWLLEAERIVAGHSHMQPERQHLIALFRVIVKLGGQPS